MLSTRNLGQLLFPSAPPCSFCSQVLLQQHFSSKEVSKTAHKKRVIQAGTPCPAKGVKLLQLMPWILPEQWTPNSFWKLDTEMPLLPGLSSRRLKCHLCLLNASPIWKFLSIYWGKKTSTLHLSGLIFPVCQYPSIWEDGYSGGTISNSFLLVQPIGTFLKTLWTQNTGIFTITKLWHYRKAAQDQTKYKPEKSTMQLRLTPAGFQLFPHPDFHTGHRPWWQICRNATARLCLLILRKKPNSTVHSQLVFP